MQKEVRMELMQHINIIKNRPLLPKRVFRSLYKFIPCREFIL